MFSKDGPHAWKTFKGQSRLDGEIEAVVTSQAKEEARASIGEIIGAEKQTPGQPKENRVESV